jgi:hypothetical protein
MCKLLVEYSTNDNQESTSLQRRFVWGTAMKLLLPYQGGPRFRPARPSQTKVYKGEQIQTSGNRLGMAHLRTILHDANDSRI